MPAHPRHRRGGRRGGRAGLLQLQQVGQQGRGAEVGRLSAQLVGHFGQGRRGGRVGGGFELSQQQRRLLQKRADYLIYKVFIAESQPFEQGPVGGRRPGRAAGFGRRRRFCRCGPRGQDFGRTHRA